MKRIHLPLAVGTIIALGALGSAAWILLRQQQVDPSVPPTVAASASHCEMLGEHYWRIPRTLRAEYYRDPTRLNEDIQLKPVPGPEPDSVSTLVIAELSPRSPVYAAGFRKGDRVLKVDEKPVSTMARALNLVHEVEAARRLTVQVDRNGEVLTFRFEFE